MTFLCVCVRAGSRDDGKGKLKDIRLHGFPGDRVMDFGRRKAQVDALAENVGGEGR
jgi:hypothetical protein